MTYWHKGQRMSLKFNLQTSHLIYYVNNILSPHFMIAGIAQKGIKKKTFEFQIYRELRSKSRTQCL